jgi:basic membrane protein A and related proteins
MNNLGGKMRSRITVTLLVIVAFLLGGMLTACQPAEAPAAVEEEAPAAAEEEAPAAAEEEAPPKFRMALILQGTIDDGNWNGMAYRGLLSVEEMGFETTYTESVDDADVARVMRNYATEDWDVIWAHSGTYPNAVMEVAPDFPETSFAVPTGPGLDFPSNVWQVTHEWEDAYFLAGAMAGLMTETNVVGQVGGIPIPIYSASMISYNMGVQHTNPDAKVFEPVFVGDFNDPVAAKQAAAAQIEEGADIICSSVDLGVYGMIEAAREQEGVKIMTILSDMYETAPDAVISSALMDYPEAVIAVAEYIANGEVGGVHRMSWSEGNAHWADLHDAVPDDVIAKLAEIEKELLAGNIDVYTQADLFADME